MNIFAQSCAITMAVLVLSACQNTDVAISSAHVHPHSVAADPVAWDLYLARSDYWREVDGDFIQAELDAVGLDEQVMPRYTSHFGFDARQPVEWYNTEEGQRVADILLSFQTPSGGWSKRTDMAYQPRQPGQAFGVSPKYVPTFDNDATTTQMKVLARAYEATGNGDYANAFLRGVNLILDAQYPNGCWPQIYPLSGEYHDHLTFNDEAIENNLDMLVRVSQAKGEYAFVTEDVRQAAAGALALGLECVLNTQVVIDGERTIWAAQYDRYTLEPAWARAYEMPSLAAGESASLLRFLMTLENPSPALIESVHAGAAWFDAHKIWGLVWDRTERVTYEDSNAGPIWARFVDIETGRPIFGDRDGLIYDDVMDVSEERRRGYGWYHEGGLSVLQDYQAWQQRFPRQQ